MVLSVIMFIEYICVLVFDVINYLSFNVNGVERSRQSTLESGDFSASRLPHEPVAGNR